MSCIPRTYTPSLMPVFGPGSLVGPPAQAVIVTLPRPLAGQGTSRQVHQLVLGLEQTMAPEGVPHTASVGDVRVP